MWAITNHDWDESAINYGNAPPHGELISLSGAFNAKEWTNVDPSYIVTGKGTYDFVLFTFDGTPLSLASRNAITPYQLQLVMEVLSDSVVIPTSSPTLPTTPALIATESQE